MEWHGIIYDGIKVGFLASIPLGPIGVLCIQRTLQKGRLSGIISGIGAATSDTIYAIIAGFSLSYIVSFIEEQSFWLQLAGALILIILGIHIFRTNPAIEIRKHRRGETSLLNDYISTFLLTISNPLVVFIFIAFFAGFGVVDPTTGIIGQLILIFGVFIGASCWWLTLTSIVGFFRSAVNLRRLFWLNKIAGVTIIAIVTIALIVWLIKDYLIN
jgi:threonine/homoserine/homoserine lactone efflux protein